MNKINLAIPFHMNHELNDAVAEFNILYNRQENNFETLMEFVQEYPNTRINIEFVGDVSASSVVTLRRLNSEVYVRLVEGNNNFQYIKELKEKDCPFFFDVPFCAENYCELDALIALGVSDIYVSGDLCYNLPEVSKYCHSNGVKLRTVLNRIPNTAFDKGSNPRSMIFRPQDRRVLEHYIDTFEFDCGGYIYDWSEFDVLYRAWFVREHWHGDLAEINKDLTIEYPNDTVFPHFTEYKISCERRCNKRISNRCSKCEQFLEIAETLRDKGVALTE